MSEASKSKAIVTQPEQAPETDALEQQLLADAKTPQERAMAFQLASTARQHTKIGRAHV